MSLDDEFDTMASTVVTHLDGGRAAQADSLLRSMNPGDIVLLLEREDVATRAKLYRLLDRDVALEVFERLDPAMRAELFAGLRQSEVLAFFEEMDPDDRADFFSVLPSNLGDPILRRIGLQDPEAARDVRDLRQWPETSAGGLMTTDYIDISPGLSIRQAIDEVRKLADDAETIDTLFVTSPTGRLLGILTLKRMLLTEAEARVADVMASHFISVPPDLDQEDVARKLAKYDLTAMPVVTDDGELLGVITADDVLDVLTEEQSEDVHKMGAMQPLRDGYLDTGYWLFLGKRAPWLLVLFFGGFLTTQTMQAFETELALVTQLAFYLPLLVSAGGNSGSQSSTLIIRALAVGDIDERDWFRVLFKEGLQGLTLGIMLAALGVGRAALAGDGPAFALLVGATIVAIVLMGCVIGAMTPLLLHRVGLDPATSSTPFIATLVDVAGIVVYLSLARLLLESLAAAHPG